MGEGYIIFKDEELIKQFHNIPNNMLSLREGYIPMTGLFQPTEAAQMTEKDMIGCLQKVCYFILFSHRVPCAP